MKPRDIYELAEELNFIVEHDDDGTIILITGVVDETKRSADDEAESFETFDEIVESMTASHDFDPTRDEIYDEETDY